ncbi:hypothetical protein L2E82_50874 [Cichorium intybus]|nr:hypothetical protein L2E82_50874 [Cichorium intybus]
MEPEKFLDIDNSKTNQTLDEFASGYQRMLVVALGDLEELNDVGIGVKEGVLNVENGDGRSVHSTLVRGVDKVRRVSNNSDFRATGKRHSGYQSIGRVLCKIRFEDVYR